MAEVYTEDNILVQNIFVYKIPRNIKEHEIRKYFKQFGKILKVRLDDKSSSKRRAGFINFAKPIAAAKTLQKVDHYLESQFICVKAGNSWHQPAVTQQRNMYWKRNHQLVDDYYLQSKRVRVNEPNNTSCGQAEAATHQSLDHILPPPTVTPSVTLNLNDDCLLHIFKMLELHDQMKFALACPRFWNVFKLCSKLEYKRVDLNKTENLTLWELRLLFEIAGSNVEVLTSAGAFRYREVMKLCRQYCPLVKIINFKQTFMVTARSLRKLFERLVDLTVVNLKECLLDDKCILALKSLRKLKSLTLSESFSFTGLHLNKLKTVEELNLYACGDIEAIYFMKIFQSLKKLHTLDIRRCRFIQSALFCDMVKDGQRLEALKTSIRDDEYNIIARFPKLKHLELRDSSRILDITFFDTLAEYKSQKLEYLKIDSKHCIKLDIAIRIAQLKQLKHLICPNNDRLNDECLRHFSDLKNLEVLVINNCRAITNHGLLTLLSNCVHLRYLDINRCVNITNKFVFDAIKILHSHKTERNGPLMLFVGKTCITKSKFINPRYLAVAHLLKLSFDNAPTASHESASESFVIGHYVANEHITEDDFFNVDNYADTDDDDSESHNDPIYNGTIHNENAEDWE